MYESKEKSEKYISVVLINLNAVQFISYIGERIENPSPIQGSVAVISKMERNALAPKFMPEMLERFFRPLAASLWSKKENIVMKKQLQIL